MSNLTNDQIILNRIIDSNFVESEAEMSKPDYFEIYTASEILKNHDLSYDEIKDGIVAGGADGGIDSIFTFLNGELIKEDTKVNSAQKKNQIELVVIQSKTSTSFEETPIVKLKESAEDLFNLSNNPQDFLSRYNQDLINKAMLFRNVYEKLASTFPNLKISYFYASQGVQIHPNVQGKVPKLEELILSLFGGASFSFHFIGAKELLELTRDTPSISRTLEVSESPISTDSGSYVCLVFLSKYYEFLSDDDTLARSIFESNVRDYQGDVVVNNGIRSTLGNENSENFWYLNNGVTIITPNVVLAGKKLTIEDPQIVNGLQTSYEVYKHFSELEDNQVDERAILVRVICEQNEEARDRIIRATNSQTSIPPASLRSSDEIHRNIEDFLKSNDFFYDRKKNYYKNQGKPVAKIIGIPYMAQALMAILLLRPDNARARPSTLINQENEYSKLFSLDTPIDVYLKVIQIIKKVEVYLRPENCGNELPRKDITNIKFYIAMVLGKYLCNGRDDMVSSLSKLPTVDIPDDLFKKAYEFVWQNYQTLGGNDQVAKGPDLTKILLSQLSN